MTLASALPLLRCPISKVSLAFGEVAEFNAAIARGGVINRAGKPVDQPADQILIAENQPFAYLVRDGIPILMPEEAIHSPII